MMFLSERIDASKMLLVPKIHCSKYLFDQKFIGPKLSPENFGHHHFGINICFLQRILSKKIGVQQLLVKENLVRFFLQYFWVPFLLLFKSPFGS